ncbi:MAG: hypothetical protein KA354_03225 [Phycisphaerae bacterium]|nr:hypothetical protein [Phycisphaerae bacterium]
MTGRQVHASGRRKRCRAVRTAVFTALLLAADASRVAGAGDRPEDYAVEVVEYVEGTGVPKDWLVGIRFNNQVEVERPLPPLRRPTVDTTGDGFNTGSPSQAVPVVPVNPPLRYYELVSVGEGGRLILKLGRPATDNPANPYGIDFIVFGNTFAVIGGTTPWRNGDPNLTTLGTVMLSREPGKVSVSRTGPPEAYDWHTFENGPYADDFAPTLGRRYDPAAPDPSLGVWNLWWGQPTDPRVPLKPALTATRISGRTVAQAARLYGVSAGGVGFDLAAVGLDSALYVKIENPIGSGLSPDIDAVAIVDAAAAQADPDLDGDLDVDEDDLVVFRACVTGAAMGPPSAPCRQADLDGDSDVDQSDFGLLQRCRGGPDELVFPDCVR